jgi:hypothetical protein
MKAIGSTDSRVAAFTKSNYEQNALDKRPKRSMDKTAQVKIYWGWAYYRYDIALFFLNTCNLR